MTIQVTDAQRRAFAGLPSTAREDDSDNAAVVDMMWAAAEAEVERYAPDAPEAIQRIAALSTFAYLWSNRAGDVGGGDSGSYTRGGNALRKSGALALLKPYAVHRAGAV